MKNELLDRLDSELSFLTSLNKDEVKELYDEVNNFVKSNFLGDGEEEKYYLKYNNSFYQVGLLYGPEVLYFVRITNGNDEITSYVDYENMKNNVLTESEREIKGMLDNIHSNVEELKEKGASVKLLQKTFKFWNNK